MYPPWLAKPYLQLSQSLEHGSQAMLLTGMRGVGKRMLAEHVARSRLCAAPIEGNPCGTCDTCGLVAAGNHPDFIVLEPSQEDEPEGEGAAKKAKVNQHIVIEQVRALLDGLGLASHGHQGRVIIVDPADRLNVSAANALLKTLEEPLPKTIFLLITSREERLPITVRSRCTRIPFARPDHRESLRWLTEQKIEGAETLLRLAGGAPIQALVLGHSGWVERAHGLVNALPFQGQKVTEWDTTSAGLDELCHLLQMLCVDLQRTRLGGATIYFEPNAAVIGEAARGISLDTLADFWKSVGKIRAVVHHPLNGALVRDQLLLALDRMLHPSTGTQVT